MNMKKITAIAAAAIIAAGICTGVPTGTENISPLVITAEAADSDFVIKTDDDGFKFIAEYKGKGGDVKIPDDVDYIGDSAFAGNMKIKSVTFPKKCDLIGSYAFKECINLEKVVFEGDAGFGESSFEFCISLKSVTVKGGMAYPVYAAAFWGCQSLKTVKISKGKATGDEFFIGGDAFRDCFSLASITIPEGCTEIYGCAFFNCFNLEKLTIPAKTKINTDDGGECHFGYASLFKTKSGYENYIYEEGNSAADVFVADGKKSGYFDKYQVVSKVKNYDDLYYVIGENSGIYLGVGKYTPKKLTLTVTKDSPAEKWAKKNKVAYIYAGESSDSAKSAAPANFKASKTNNSITLKWDKADGADMYRVYKYNEKTGKYEKYKDVKSEKCTISGLSANTKYKFKVAAYDKVDGKYVKGESSKAVSVTTKK